MIAETCISSSFSLGFTARAFRFVFRGCAKSQDRRLVSALELLRRPFPATLLVARTHHQELETGRHVSRAELAEAHAGEVDGA